MYKTKISALVLGLTLSSCQLTSNNQSTPLQGNTQKINSKNYQIEYQTTPTMSEQNIQNQTVILKTNYGDITIKLFSDKAPKTVENFLGLASGQKQWTNPSTGQVETKKSLYSGTIFHRVIADFMIQGGDPLGTGTGGPGYKFADEFNSELKFDKPYLLAMANSGPNTNGSQFFITVAATPWLNNKHTIFGEVTNGQDIVDKIATAKTDQADKPLENIVIQSIDLDQK